MQPETVNRTIYKNDWSALHRLLDSVQTVLITTHVRPDADALGSELGLATLLRNLGKKVTILNSSATPPRYRFLDPTGEAVSAINPGSAISATHPDLIMVVDTGTWSQLAGLADWVKGSPAKRFVIDHHVTQDDLGGERLVDVSSPACGILICEAFDAFGQTFDPASANALFAAIAMDTGWMHHPNTNHRALTWMARLVDCGAQPAAIYRQLFERNSLARCRLMGTLLSRMDLMADGRLCHATIHLSDIHAAGAHPMDTEDFIQLMMAIDGVQVAALFIEQDGGTKVSLRSRSDFDCAKFASHYGGGGHRPAAGATIARPVDSVRDEFLDKLKSQV